MMKLYFGHPTFRGLFCDFLKSCHTKRLFSKLNSFNTRTHTCGELKIEHVGQEVVLCGWITFQRCDKFIILRDGYGSTQVLLGGYNPEFNKFLFSLPLESVVQIKGVVLKRPAGNFNKDLTTGEVEVKPTDIKLLNGSISKLPFTVKDYENLGDVPKLKYRYLALRQPRLLSNLRTRSEVLMRMRKFLHDEHGFVEVETPTLFKRTPGGAKEFIVPTKFPGEFYSLVQSPQQFKQLLMVGAVDRYFQIARCYRNESTKVDRQPEFTQVDIEASFTTVEDIKSLVENLLKFSWPQEKSEISIPFPSISYEDAIHQYGTDKPDTRYGMKIQYLTDDFVGKGIHKIDQSITGPNSVVSAIVVPSGTKSLKKMHIEELQELARLSPVGYLMDICIKKDFQWNSFLAKHISTDLQDDINNKLDVKPLDRVFLATGNKIDVCKLLGKVRVSCAEYLVSSGHQIYKSSYMNFIWVVDFPLFQESSEGIIESCHHPFTAPHPDYIDDIYSNPLKVQSLAYDLVLNGQEIAGGSIRIHDYILQKYILEEVLKEDASSLQHLLDALQSGCPPHGGIALGVERLLAIMCGCKSIANVMAFPKSRDGKDLLSGCPTTISEKEKLLYHIEPKL